MNLTKYIEKASQSAFYLWLLNMGLQRAVPFNKPHRFRIQKIEKGKVEIKLPFIRKNQNHIKGLHACSMATLAEYSTGLTLLSCLDPKKYRLIMQKIEMEYFYQGKTDAIASFQITNEWLQSNVLEIVEAGSPAIITCEIHIHDINQNKLATGNIHWQIKSWDDVKTTLT